MAKHSVQVEEAGTREKFRINQREDAQQGHRGESDLSVSFDTSCNDKKIAFT